MRYKFIGIEAEIVGVARMDRFGQTVDLPDGMEAEAAAALCVPEEKFNEIFKDFDVAPYEMVASHADATKDFHERKRAAAAALAADSKKTKGGR